MIYLIFSAMLPILLLGSAYTGVRLRGFLKLFFPNMKRYVFWLVFSFFPLCFLTSNLLGVSVAAKILSNIGYIFLGVLMYAFLVLVAIDLVRIFVFAIKKITNKELTAKVKRATHIATGSAACILVAVVVVGGYINANIIKTAEYDVEINKAAQADELKVVAVSDLHLGYQIGASLTERAVKKINQQNPDMVVIVGDIFDGDMDKVFDLEEIKGILAEIKTKYGVFAVLGNHDRYSVKLEAFLSDSGITLITDNSLLINDSFYLVGRNDRNYIGGARNDREQLKDIMEDVDRTKPIIVLDHRPDSIDETKNSGADLLLCGHSHKGQVFPANLITKRVYSTDYGYAEYDDLKMIVTSGAGYWGPPLRVGSESEIAVINIKFTG